MINLTKFQQEVVNAPKGINLVPVGVGAGSSYAAIARSIKIGAEKDKHVVIFIPVKRQAYQYFEQFIPLMELLGYRVSRTSMIFTNKHTGSKIKIFSPTKEELIITHLGGEFIVERPEDFKLPMMNNIIRNVLSSSATLTLFTRPEHCGNKYSWDTALLNVELLEPIWKELPEFKAQPKHYRSFVNIITGYNHKDNPHMDSSFGHLIEGNFDEKVTQNLLGVWKNNELK
jgi:hypothetical protein